MHQQMMQERWSERMEHDPYDLATAYLGWFARECHFTPQQVYDMPWFALIKLTFNADDDIEQRKSDKARADIEAARNRG